MMIDVFLYKRFDTDLVALYYHGFPVREMMRQSLIAYAHKEPIRFCTGEPVFFDMNGKKSVRIRFSVQDAAAREVLKHVKHHERSAFCRSLLRNALVQQNLCAFFSDDSLFSIHKENFAGKATPTNALYSCGTDGKIVPVTAAVSQEKVVQPVIERVVPVQEPKISAPQKPVSAPSTEHITKAEVAPSDALLAMFDQQEDF